MCLSQRNMLTELLDPAGRQYVLSRVLQFMMLRNPISLQSMQYGFKRLWVLMISWSSQ